MPVVRSGPLIGLGVQIALLFSLTGLGIAGWLAGAAYGIVVCGLLTWGLHRSGASSLGPADWVTLTRACLVGGVTALVAAGGSDRTVLIGLCVAALILDLVDGWVARRTKTATPLGARFDMEVDAFLILVLSVYVSQGMGGWVLSIGAMRYAYLVATWLAPWLRGPLPPRYWRKVVAAIAGIVLVIAAADVLPDVIAVVAVAGVLALLIESFGRDIWWRWQSQMESQHARV